MKRVLIILFIVTISTKNINAQVPDTLAYLKAIVANKSQFTGKPFSVLLDSLKIKIKHFWPNRSMAYSNKEPSTQFSFYEPGSAEDVFSTFPSLEVFWKTPLDAGQSDMLWVNCNGNWFAAAATFYSNEKIANIKIQK